MNTSPRWRTACALVTLAFAGLAAAQTLQPFQEEALEQILSTLDPALRPMMRAQLLPTLAIMDRQQIETMVAAMTGDGAEDAGDEDSYEEDFEEDVEDEAATEEDLAYNRAQYEPAIRRAWQAGKAYDDFVAAQLAMHCGSRGEFAIFGSAWRYEVYPLNPTWPTVSNSAELDVQIVGPSYAPQDGRYDFDFSDVRNDFDEAAVADAVATTCAEYAEIGATFLAEARANVTSSDAPPPDADAIAARANGKANAVRERLEAALQSAAPGGNSALILALLNGQRVN